MGTVTTVEFNDLLRTGRKKVDNTSTYLTIDEGKTTTVNYIHASIDGEIITNKRLLLPTIRTEQPSNDAVSIDADITATVERSYTDSDVAVIDLLNAEKLELRQETTTTVTVQKPNQKSVQNNPYQPDVYVGNQVFTVCKLISKIKERGGATINTELEFETSTGKKNIQIRNIPVFVEIELLKGSDEVGSDLTAGDEIVLSKHVDDEVLETLPLHSFDTNTQDELLEDVFEEYESYPSTVKQSVLSAVRNASIGCREGQNTAIANAVYEADGGVFADVYGDMIYPTNDESEVLELLGSVAGSDVVNSSRAGYSNNVLTGVVSVVESAREIVRSEGVAEGVVSDYNELFERVLFPVFESVVSDFTGDGVGVVDDRSERVVDLVLEWLRDGEGVDVSIGEGVLEGVIVGAVNDGVSVSGEDVVDVLGGEYDEVCDESVKESVVDDLSESVEIVLEDVFEDKGVGGDEEDEFDEIMTVYESITGDELDLGGGEESKVKHADGDIPVGYGISGEESNSEDVEDGEISEEVAGESDGESEEVAGESDGESEETSEDVDEEISDESDDKGEMKSLNDF